MCLGLKIYGTCRDNHWRKNFSSGNVSFCKTYKKKSRPFHCWKAFDYEFFRLLVFIYAGFIDIVTRISGFQFLHPFFHLGYSLIHHFVFNHFRHIEQVNHLEGHMAFIFAQFILPKQRKMPRGPHVFIGKIILHCPMI